MHGGKGATVTYSAQVELTLDLVAYFNALGDRDYTENVEYFKIGVIAQALRAYGIEAKELKGKWINTKGQEGGASPSLFGVLVDGVVIGSYGDIGWKDINRKLMDLHDIHEVVDDFMEPMPSGAPRNFYPAGSSLTRSLDRLAQLGLTRLQAHELEQHTQAATGETKGSARL